MTEGSRLSSNSWKLNSTPINKLNNKQTSIFMGQGQSLKMKIKDIEISENEKNSTMECKLTVLIDKFIAGKLTLEMGGWGKPGAGGSHL
jgi:hypothetical protein